MAETAISVSRSNGGLIFVDFIFELLFEFVFQILTNLFAELLFGTPAPNERADLLFLRCFFVGGGLGGLSLLIFRTHLIDDQLLRYASAVLTPLLIGFVMSRASRLRVKHGDESASMEYSVASWGFAFAFGVIRVVFAK